MPTDFPSNTHEEIEQDRRDAEYMRAWDEAPESFKRAASLLELKAEEGSKMSNALELDENYTNVSYSPDMTTLDKQADILTEKYGAQHEAIIIAVLEDLKKPMEKEIEQNRAMLLSRVAMYLVKSKDNTNILAKIHQLLHAVPLLAKANGFGSMRESAKECGVAPNWIKKGRDHWCQILGIPIPAEGQKTDEAKQKYKDNALKNHWRTRKYGDTPEAIHSI